MPVVGGHAGVTILPLFSQATPGHSLDKATVEALTKRTQDGGTEVVQAKAGKVCSPGAPGLPACLPAAPWGSVCPGVWDGISCSAGWQTAKCTHRAGLSDAVHGVRRRAVRGCLPQSAERGAPRQRIRLRGV